MSSRTVGIVWRAQRRERKDDCSRWGISPESRRKLHLLADAFRRLRKRDGVERVRLEAAGYMAPADAKYLADIRRSLDRVGLAGDFSYQGAVDRDGKLAFLRRLDVLSVPAVYDEPKGIFLLEAMASGVPVVQPRRGAFTEIVERTGGGLLCEPDKRRLAESPRLWRTHASPEARPARL